MSVDQQIQNSQYIIMEMSVKERKWLILAFLFTLIVSHVQANDPQDNGRRSPIPSSANVQLQDLISQHLTPADILSLGVPQGIDDDIERNLVFTRVAAQQLRREDHSDVSLMVGRLGELRLRWIAVKDAVRQMGEAGRYPIRGGQTLSFSWLIQNYERENSEMKQECYSFLDARDRLSRRQQQMLTSLNIQLENLSDRIISVAQENQQAVAKATNEGRRVVEVTRLQDVWLGLRFQRPPSIPVLDRIEQYEEQMLLWRQMVETIKALLLNLKDKQVPAVGIKSVLPGYIQALINLVSHLTRTTANAMLSNNELAANAEERDRIGRNIMEVNQQISLSEMQLKEVPTEVPSLNLLTGTERQIQMLQTICQPVHRRCLDIMPKLQGENSFIRKVEMADGLLHRKMISILEKEVILVHNPQKKEEIRARIDQYGQYLLRFQRGDQ